MNLTELIVKPLVFLARILNGFAKLTLQDLKLSDERKQIAPLCKFRDQCKEKLRHRTIKCVGRTEIGSKSDPQFRNGDI